MSKYYLITYATGVGCSIKFENIIVEKHPFRWLADDATSEQALINWHLLDDGEVFFAETSLMPTLAKNDAN